MALNTQLSDASANAACNGAAALVNGGSIKIYTGAQPANANAAASGTLLATLPLNTPAFGNAAAGTAALNASGVSAAAVATGTAGYARFCKSDGSAAWDASIGTSGCNINMNSTSIQSGATVQITSYTFSIAEAGS
jgi:hypothetical protein